MAAKGCRGLWMRGWCLPLCIIRDIGCKGARLPAGGLGGERAESNPPDGCGLLGKVVGAFGHCFGVPYIKSSCPCAVRCLGPFTSNGNDEPITKHYAVCFDGAEICKVVRKSRRH
ncbi:unnamed protein product [Ostreobium quekettii]|uniref:Secreted protein n=1 Tax=Ostreobium quekettii TaxID=121088 RepID=A0A8S1IR59_9CHLO|nr:unnamed protein product [Ostreobium quekettii]